MQTRVASCAGFDFHPIDSETTYRWEGGSLYRWTDDGDGFFFCSAHLPHGAVVKKVRFTVVDSVNQIDVRFCALVRTSLRVTGEVQAMAVLSSTGLAAEPGIVRVSTTSINHGKVDNADYAYSLHCQIYFAESLSSIGGAYAGIIGADVTYTISATNG